MEQTNKQARIWVPEIWL